jgi:hypothetical protein
MVSIAMSFPSNNFPFPGGKLSIYSLYCDRPLQGGAMQRDRARAAAKQIASASPFTVCNSNIGCDNS